MLSLGHPMLGKVTLISLRRILPSFFWKTSKQCGGGKRQMVSYNPDHSYEITEADLIQFKAWTLLCLLLLQLICSERRLGQTPILSKMETDHDSLEIPS